MRIRPRLHRQDGAAAVEFALIVGVLAMLIFGMLQFGLTFFELQNLRASAREGARIGAVGATPTGVRNRTADASNGAFTQAEANANANFVQVQFSNSGGAPWTSKTGNTSPVCSGGTGNQTNAAVRVQISVANAPSDIQDIFTVNIPLLPPITMQPLIDAQFRCEGVS
jgi:Flp pilus assembly protein TadG